MIVLTVFSSDFDQMEFNLVLNREDHSQIYEHFLFLSILNQMESHLVQNRKKNCRHDHIPFNLEGNGNIVFSVYSHESVYS